MVVSDLRLLRIYLRWLSLRALLVVAVGLVGCQGETPASCPAPQTVCPATLPTAGAPCVGTSAPGGCEYGDDPSYACGTVAICNGQEGWYIQPTLSQSCPTSSPASCPPSFAEAETAGAQFDCTSLPAGATCLYPEGACSCQPGFSCTPPAPASCPATRPRAGTPCSGACTTWGTGAPDNQSMVCKCGVWRPVFGYD